MKKGIAGILLLTLFAYTLVLPGAAFSYRRVENAGKEIALTFDDGPHPKYTEQILNILEEEGVKATFFFVGENVEYYKTAAKAVAEAGHEIQNHTYSHPNGGRISAADFLLEIEKTDKLIEELGVEKPTCIRPPQGVCSPAVNEAIAKSGKTTVLWSIDTRDWAHRSPENIVEDAVGHIGGGDIILFHDFVSGKNTTVPALKKLIPLLKKKGYTFVTVSALLQKVKS